MALGACKEFLGRADAAVGVGGGLGILLFLLSMHVVPTYKLACNLNNGGVVGSLFNKLNGKLFSAPFALCP